MEALKGDDLFRYTLPDDAECVIVVLHLGDPEVEETNDITSVPCNAWDGTSTDNVEDEAIMAALTAGTCPRCAAAWESLNTRPLPERWIGR